MGKIKVTWNDEVLFEGNRTDAVVPTPPTPPVPPVPPTEPPPVPPVPPVPPAPTTGQFTEAIKSAHLLNTQIKTPSGAPTSFGYGFKDQCVPGPVSVRGGGKTYFLGDPSWFTNPSSTLKFKWYNFALNTKNFRITLYKIDASDNGTSAGSSTNLQAFFSVARTPGFRYLLEVDATQSEGYGLSVTWPN